MKRLTLLISGNVQKAGYRDIVIRFGTVLGLRGYAENLPDGSVKLVAEGDEKKLELLKDSANITDTLINVEKIDGSFSDATGEFSGFYKLVKEGETDERLDRAAELMKQLIGVVQNGFNDTVDAIKSVKADTSAMLDKQDKMLDKQDKMLDKQDGMLDKQDEMLEQIKEMHSDINRGFADLKEEVHMQRDDLKEMFLKEVSELHSEINDIRATLIRMQQAQEA
jgi:acylphosphatase